ncbi:uncharacterized protein NECHADRAFT_75684 [Fusarium vanettenii 77-13-4]|uniref:alcohol dehydrogenase n=1 Tax=Fusarium vanettenii (strain ATCC MYA-4622 / CBS 123669 / FGSC 9596 / NRRL 45880 / 77-13-4) TaxID=660122 RepID=C7YJH9_FUSV7|nr:uncharacterized protein NECHADRAFT_75684 [Fusarium vanettenii 77-13-4]EEU48280.1 hypothetical protein NECHADRAFT_75684 [Fusarium vanettenii 77-13-4]
MSDLFCSSVITNKVPKLELELANSWFMPQTEVLMTGSDSVILFLLFPRWFMNAFRVMADYTDNSLTTVSREQHPSTGACHDYIPCNSENAMPLLVGALTILPVDQLEEVKSSGPDSGYVSPQSQEIHDLKHAAALGEPLPSFQKAIVTPTMGPQLNLTCRTIPVRQPGPGEAVVQLYYSGICRSDACFSIGPEPGYPKHDHVAGHEGIGRIVRAYDASLIDKLVAIRYLGSTCQSCSFCLRGLLTSCPFQLNSPKQVSGTFKEYATVPTSCLVRLPEALSKEGTAMLPYYTTALCSGSTALMALKGAEVGPEHVVVVVGVAGAIGNMAGMMAKQVRHAKVIGIDLSNKIIRLPPNSDQFGDIFLSAPLTADVESRVEHANAVIEACRKLRGGRGVLRGADSVIICGSTPEAFRSVHDYVCDGGRIICVGAPGGDTHLSIPVKDLIERNLKVSGNLMGGSQEALQVMEYIRSGHIRPDVTLVALDDVPYQMQEMVDCRTMGKIVVAIKAE